MLSQSDTTFSNRIFLMVAISDTNKQSWLHMTVSLSGMVASKEPHTHRVRSKAVVQKAPFTTDREALSALALCSRIMSNQPVIRKCIRVLNFFVGHKFLSRLI